MYVLIIIVISYCILQNDKQKVQKNIKSRIIKRRIYIPLTIHYCNLLFKKKKKKKTHGIICKRPMDCMDCIFPSLVCGKEKKKKKKGSKKAVNITI